MKPRPVYLALCILGAGLPLSQLFPFLRDHGLDLRLFFEQLFVNRISSFFGLDVIVSAIVLFFFIWTETRRTPIRAPWLPVVATLTIGVSLGLPLFLYLREGRIERTG
jgi:hypothetical protein